MQTCNLCTAAHAGHTQKTYRIPQLVVNMEDKARNKDYRNTKNNRSKMYYLSYSDHYKQYLKVKQKQFYITYRISIISLLLLNNLLGYSQINTQQDKIQDVYQLNIHSIKKSDLVHLNSLVSIDNYNKKTKELKAYANYKQLKKLKSFPYSFSIIKPQKRTGITMAKTLQAVDNWNVYPTYGQYIQKMHELADSFPSICELDTIGNSVQNRLLLVLKISDNVKVDEAEPEFFYSSTMHGDEITGYALLLRFADYLLNNYDSLSTVKKLIDNMEIYINPLANPDGTYRTGNNDISGAIRYNANLVDPNRNFPNPLKGEHPDNEAWQPETIAMMNFMDKHHFVMSANFHGGTEVINYPWDTYQKLHPDDSWYQYVSRIYADTAHAHSTSYMTQFDSGITNGYEWYVAYGTRQDYANYFDHCREVTIELSYTKMLPASSLPQYWEFNYRSLLYYMAQAQWGINGDVYDKDTNKGIEAQIHILNHDADNSYVISDKNGHFFRPISEGTYSAIAFADGYKSDTIKSISVNNDRTTSISFSLERGDSGIESNKPEIHSYPNPFTNILKINLINRNIRQIQIVNLEGKIVLTKNVFQDKFIILDTQKLTSGIYLLRLKSKEKIESTKIIKIKE